MYYKLGQAVLQIEAVLFYCKLRQTLLLLQIGPKLITNWGRYYK